MRHLTEAEAKKLLWKIWEADTEDEGLEKLGIKEICLVCGNTQEEIIANLKRELGIATIPKEYCDKNIFKVLLFSQAHIGKVCGRYDIFFNESHRFNYKKYKEIEKSISFKHPFKMDICDFDNHMKRSNALVWL